MAYEGKYICKTPYDLNNATMSERLGSCDAADKDSNPPFYARQICIENCHYDGSRVHNFGRKTKKSKTKKSKSKKSKKSKSKKSKKSKTKKSNKSKKSKKKSARK
jgi:hypothetical protein